MTVVAPYSRARAWRTAIVCGMASYIDSALLVGASIAVVIYQGIYKLSPLDVGLIQGSLTFSVGIGALVGGRLGDRFGRRPIFTLTMLLTIVGSGVLVFSTAPALLILGSILVGLGTGADLPVSLSTISEAASEKDRGTLVGFSQQLWLLGIVGAVLLGTLFAPLGHLGGQILYAHAGVVAIVVLLFRLGIPESESWKEARQERLAGVHTVRAERASLTLLLRPPYIVPFVGLAVFYSFINLIASNNGGFSAYLLVNVAHQTPQFASFVGLVSLPFGFVFGAWFMRIVRGSHRFLYFKIGAVLTVVAPMTVVVFGFSVPTYLISLILSLPAGAFAGEALMKFWTQQQFPTLLRTTAQGTIIAVARFIAAAAATLTPLVITQGATVLYAILAAFAAIGMVVAWVVFRKRDGHSEFQIEEAPASAEQVSVA